MAVGDVIAGIDIGTSKVCTILGEVNNFGQIEILSTTSSRCNGIRKGKIVNEEEISSSILKTVEEAEGEIGFRISSAYITIPGRYITIVQNSVLKEVKDRYAGITQKDLQSAIQLVKDIEVPENRTIADIVVDEVILEDGKTTTDPVGNLSSSFTVNAQVILAEKDYVKKITGIFKKAGIEIDGIVPVTLAERNLVLDKNELHDNIMLLDVGAGNTDIGVFEGNNFIYTDTIPLGGDNITNDIALVLSISEEEADKLKRQYGFALKSFIDNDNEIMLNTCKDENRKKVIKSSELIEIMEARIEEIFTLVNKNVTNQGIKSRINNVVLTGQGITNISKSDVAGKIALNIPVKISTGRAMNTVRPEFRTCYSLIRYIATRPFAKSVSSKIDTNKKENVFKTALSRIKEFFYS